MRSVTHALLKPKEEILKQTKPLTVLLVSGKLDTSHFALLKNNLFNLPKTVFCPCKITDPGRTFAARRVRKEK